MNPLPKIAIITPTLNQAAFIEATIQSVLHQNYPNLTYIVVDGGSTDGTLDILKKYDSQIKWISEADRGQSDAINKGFRMADHSDIFAYINSDDTYQPSALHKVAAYYQSHPQADWITGKTRIIDGEGNEIRKLITLYKNFWLSINSYNALLVLDYVSQPSTFWSRNVIQNVGYFDETMHFSMDYEYSLRVGQTYKLHVIPDYLANFRIHPTAKSGNIKEYFDTDLAAAIKHTDSKLLHTLHKLHNQLIVMIYKILQSRTA